MFTQCYKLFKQLKHGIIILLKCINNITKNNNIFTLFINNYTIVYTLFSSFCTNNSRKKFIFSLILYIVGNCVSMYYKIARCARAPCTCLHVRPNLEIYAYLPQATVTALFNRACPINRAFPFSLCCPINRVVCISRFALLIGQHLNLDN